MTSQVKLENLNDFLSFLGVKETDLQPYFKIRDNILSSGQIILPQRVKWFPKNIRAKLMQLGAEYEPGDGLGIWTVNLRRQEVNPLAKLEWISLEKLRSFSFQARVVFDHMGLLALAATIKTYGVIEPLVVRPVEDGFFEVVTGERRFRASSFAHITRVPCIVRSLSDQQTLECAMVENVQRVDLTDYEVARMLDEMTKRFGYTQEQLAEKVGMSREWVGMHLRMLDLEKENIVTRVTMEKLTEGHAREILAAPPEQRPYVATQVSAHIAQEGVPPSVREIRRFWHQREPEEGTEKEEAEEQEHADSEEVVNLESKHRPEPPTRNVPDVSGAANASSAPCSKSALKPALRSEPEPLLTGFEVECPECHKKLLINHIHWPGGKDAHEIEAES